MLLEGLGVDPNDHNFAETPRRYAKMMEEMFDVDRTETPVFEENYTDIVILRGHVLYTLCPHHLADVRIRASVAYYPNGRVIGASKLVRLMHDCNSHPMTQEVLTDAVLRRIQELTQGMNDGCAVMLEGEHNCMRMRGVRSEEADMVTYKFSGRFKNNPEEQRLFLQMVGGRD
jgi:GTP cyclohydrolase I